MCAGTGRTSRNACLRSLLDGTDGRSRRLGGFDLRSLTSSSLTLRLFGRGLDALHLATLRPHRDLVRKARPDLHVEQCYSGILPAGPVSSSAL